MPKFAETGPSVLKRVDSLAGRLGLVASAILAPTACFTRRVFICSAGRFPEP